MLFFDSNCMLGRWPSAKLEFYDTRSLLNEMDYHGIAKALVFHSLSWMYHPPFGNQKLLDEISGYDRLCPSWVLLPPSTSENIENDIVEEMKKHNIVAARLFPKDHNYKLEEWNCGELLSPLEEVRIPLFINLDQVDFTDIACLCERHPGLPLILTMTSYRSGRMLYPLLQKFENLMVEISTLITFLGLEDIVNRFGAKRLLFGTSMPFQDAGAAIAMVTYAQISDGEKDMIAYKNLVKLIESIKRR